MNLPILVAGDSYSTDWPAQFSKLVPNPITNISSLGRSNLFIWSSAINYLAKVDTKHIVIVGNSFITRTDTWVENQKVHKIGIKNSTLKGKTEIDLYHYNAMIKNMKNGLELRTYVHYGKNIIMIYFVLLTH